MKHAREDYNRIQDPDGKIPEDEPVFLLRASDRVAPFVVEAWAAMADIAGAGKEMIRHAHYQSIRMRDWQARHGSKVPDMPNKD